MSTISRLHSIDDAASKLIAATNEPFELLALEIERQIEAFQADAAMVVETGHMLAAKCRDQGAKLSQVLNLRMARIAALKAEFARAMAAIDELPEQMMPPKEAAE